MKIRTERINANLKFEDIDIVSYSKILTMIQEIVKDDDVFDFDENNHAGLEQVALSGKTEATKNEDEKFSIQNIIKGYIIWQTRHERKITKEELARRIQCDVSDIEDYEKGKAKIPDFYEKRIKEVLGEEIFDDLSANIGTGSFSYGRIEDDGSIHSAIEDDCDVYNIERAWNYEISDVQRDPEHDSIFKRILGYEIVELFNSICISYSKVRVSVRRDDMIFKIWNNNGKSKDVFENVFRNMEQSDFLKGNNAQGWKASFDWVLQQSPFQHVYSGEYNKGKSSNSNNLNADSNTVKSKQSDQKPARKDEYEEAINGFPSCRTKQFFINLLKTVKENPDKYEWKTVTATDVLEIYDNIPKVNNSDIGRSLIYISSKISRFKGTKKDYNGKHHSATSFYRVPVIPSNATLKTYENIDDITIKENDRRRGKILKEERTNAGFGASDFASAIHYPLPVVNGWEIGTHTMSDDAIKTVNKFFNKDIFATC